MEFLARVVNYQQNKMLNICDADLLGKTITENELNIHINKNYYGEKLITENEAEMLLKNSSIINMAGKETIALSLKIGVGSVNGVKTISNIPFLIVFNM